MNYYNKLNLVIPQSPIVRFYLYKMNKRIAFFLFLTLSFFTTNSQSLSETETKIIGKWHVCKLKNKSGVRTTLHCLNEVIFESDLTGAVLYLDGKEIFKWRLKENQITFSQDSKRNDYLFYEEYELKFTIETDFTELEMTIKNGDSIILRRPITTTADNH